MINREKFEKRVCELINKKQKTNFEPYHFEGMKDTTFMIEDKKLEIFHQFYFDASELTYKDIKKYANAIIDLTIEDKTQLAKSK